ncbi:hypothetical protein D3C76_48060 [compost metagenome]
MLAVSKRALDRLDYDLDFSKWVSDDDTLTGAEAQAVIKSSDPDAETDLTVDAVSVFGMLVKLWLSAGTNGASYAVTVTATTSGGRIKQEEFTLRIKDC